MSASKPLDPESVMLQQVDGQWQKLAALIIWKLVGRDVNVSITADDIEAMNKAFAPGQATLLTHGMGETINFRLIDEAAGQQIAAFESQWRGRA